MPNPTLFHEKLLDAGYQVFPRSPISNADWGLQKRIKSPNGETLYFINVMVYDWRNNPRFPEDWAYTPEVHFYTKNSGTEPVQFKIQANFEFELPESMEAWFSFIYHQLKCVPDPHNND